MFWKLTKKDIFSSIHRNQTKIRVLLQIKTEVAKCMKNNLSKLTAMTIWMSFQYNDSQAGNKMHCDWHAVTHTVSWHATTTARQDTIRVGAETRQCSHLSVPFVWVTCSQTLTSNGWTTLFYQVHLKLETIGHFTSRQSSSCPHMLARQWK